ncbi:MAG: CBS domain-containing protein [Phycisphaeraceae bacterium]
MSTVAELLEKKEHKLHSIEPTATVMDAANLMNKHRIGALLVVDRRGESLAGIFTERDILQRIVGEKQDPETTAVGQVMTTEVACCQPDITAAAARLIFRDKRVRHLPVVDEKGKPLGVVSIGDVNAWAMDHQRAEIHYLQEYLYGSEGQGSGGYA